jgi:primosomal protein N'
LPDISVSQRAMRIIMKTKLIAEECFLLQGRNVGLSIIEDAVACDISKFVRGELELRQKFQYAPFKKIIKISIEVDKETVKQETEKVMNFFKDWNPIHFPAIIKSKNGKSISNIIIKTEKSFGLESELKRKLMSLPYNIKVKVDPESLI